MEEKRQAEIKRNIDRHIWHYRLRKIAFSIFIPLSIPATIFVIGFMIGDIGPWNKTESVEAVLVGQKDVLIRVYAGSEYDHFKTESLPLFELEDGTQITLRIIPKPIIGKKVLLSTKTSETTGTVEYNFKCYIDQCQ